MEQVDGEVAAVVVKLMVEPLQTELLELLDQVVEEVAGMVVEMVEYILDMLLLNKLNI